MEIVFVRHSEKEERNKDSGLTKKGMKQAKNLAKRLGKEKFDEFYCSDMKRAIQTATIVSKTIKLRPKIEISLREFDSKILKENNKKWSEDLKKQYSKLKKFLNLFNKNQNSKKRILIIAHGNTNRLILATLLELNLKNMIRFRQLETAINEVYWVENFRNWRLKYWNDTSHQPKKLVEGKNNY